MQDARDALYLELGSFELLMKKNLMVCEAEARQVEEYRRERERIGVWYFILSLLSKTQRSKTTNTKLCRDRLKN